MRLRPVTKLDKKNKFWLILIFSIYGQFGAIQQPDSGRMVCKTNIFINTKLLSYKNWKQN